jgi:MYXO-CTERM domain-containing protein
MRKFHSIALMITAMAAMAGSVTHAAPAPFTQSYEADDVPESASSSPQWQKFFLGTGTASGGLLTVTTPTDAGASDDHYLEYRLDGGGAWNPTGAGTTLEMSFKTIAGSDSGWAGSALISTGLRQWSIRVGTNYVSIGGDDLYLPSLGIDSSTFHTYRFTSANDTGNLSLYIDGATTPTHTYTNGVDSAVSRLAFGDLGSPEGGQVQWDYLRWTNAGAFAPVPEPGALSLAAIGLAGLRRRRR